ncbi:hypothetical protein C8R45DRAFT_1223698 [Mycena sanguinolenta]|nr:hypothetical protein C8R45DRAFT_1223698 [Mycena sanguinolenta]
MSLDDKQYVHPRLIPTLLACPDDRTLRNESFTSVPPRLCLACESSPLHGNHPIIAPQSPCGTMLENRQRRRQAWTMEVLRRRKDSARRRHPLEVGDGERVDRDEPWLAKVPTSHVVIDAVERAPRHRPPPVRVPAPSLGPLFSVRDRCVMWLLLKGQSHRTLNPRYGRAGEGGHRVEKRRQGEKRSVGLRAVDDRREWDDGGRWEHPAEEDDLWREAHAASSATARSRAKGERRSRHASQPPQGMSSIPPSTSLPARSRQPPFRFPAPRPACERSPAASPPSGSSTIPTLRRYEECSKPVKSTRADNERVAAETRRC